MSGWVNLFEVKKIQRKIIQILATLISNPLLENLITGKIYKGTLKNFCSPGLNCYSCPAAIFSCPIGAMQTVGITAGLRFSFYAVGFILLVGIFFGRAVCGFLCPFGFFQELLHKIPTKKFELWRPLIYIKYFVLIFFVVLLPDVLSNYAGVGEPIFCEYICPAGTLEAGLTLLATHEEFFLILGKLFALKIFILVAVIVGSIFIQRFFCKMLCPLGAMYGLLNRVSFYRLQVNHSSCINCGACKKICPMSIDPTHKKNSPECILCGECKNICPTKSIR